MINITSTDSSLSLRILGAVYGQGDVTQTLRGKTSGSAPQLRIDINNATFSDTWQNVQKALVLVYQYGNLSPQVAVGKEGDVVQFDRATTAPIAGSGGSLQVLGAAWGLSDVTTLVNGWVVNGALSAIATNTALKTDGWFGVRKLLVVVYRASDGTAKVAWTEEGGTLTLAASTTTTPAALPATLSPLKVNLLWGLLPLTINALGSINSGTAYPFILYDGQATLGPPFDAFSTAPISLQITQTAPLGFAVKFPLKTGLADFLTSRLKGTSSDWQLVELLVLPFARAFKEGTVIVATVDGKDTGLGDYVQGFNFYTKVKANAFEPLITLQRSFPDFGLDRTDIALSIGAKAGLPPAFCSQATLPLNVALGTSAIICRGLSVKVDQSQGLTPNITTSVQLIFDVSLPNNPTLRLYGGMRVTAETGAVSLYGAVEPTQGPWNEPFGLKGISITNFGIEVGTAGGAPVGGGYGDARIHIGDADVAGKVAVLVSDVTPILEVSCDKFPSLSKILSTVIPGCPSLPIDTSIEDLHIYAAPNGGAIANKTYQKGVKVSGRLNLFGWHADVEGLFDPRSGGHLHGAMDALTLQAGGLTFLQLKGSQDGKPVIDLNCDLNDLSHFGGKINGQLTLLGGLYSTGVDFALSPSGGSFTLGSSSNNSLSNLYAGARVEFNGSSFRVTVSSGIRFGFKIFGQSMSIGINADIATHIDFASSFTQSVSFTFSAFGQSFTLGPVSVRVPIMKSSELNDLFEPLSDFLIDLFVDKMLGGAKEAYEWVKNNVVSTAEDAAKLFASVGADAVSITKGLVDSFGKSAEEAASIVAGYVGRAADEIKAAFEDFGDMLEEGFEEFADDVKDLFTGGSSKPKFDPLNWDPQIWDWKWYLQNNPDVRRIMGNTEDDARTHWEDSGFYEGRQGSPYFCADQYLALNHDVQVWVTGEVDKVLTALTQFLHISFDAEARTRLRSRISRQLAVRHYIVFGAREGRGGTMLLDRRIVNWRWYLKNHPDLIPNGVVTAAQARDHWLNFGLAEGRQAHPTFSATQYLDMYPDLKQAFGSDARKAIKHFFEFGIKENRYLLDGRVFDWQWYVDHHRDVALNARSLGGLWAFIPDLSALIDETFAKYHWLTSGIDEGRQAHPAFHTVKYLQAGLESESRARIDSGRAIGPYLDAARPISIFSINTSWLFTAPPVIGFRESHSSSHWSDGWFDANDLRLAGDFLGKGRAQLLCVNRSGSGGRVAVVDFVEGQRAQGLYREAYGANGWLNGWTDDGDWQLAGDFLGRGRSQLLLVNRGGTEYRLGIVELTTSGPTFLKSVTRQASPAFDGWDDQSDIWLVGDFLGRGHDQLLCINGSGTSGSGRYMIVDLLTGEPYSAYAEFAGAGSALDGWIAAPVRHLAGDFLGRGYAQWLMADPRTGKLQIFDHKRCELSSAGSLTGVHDGWLAAGNLALAADVMGLGRAQLVLVNPSRQSTHDDGVRLFDLTAAGTPTLKWLVSWQSHTCLDALGDPSTLLAAGDFLGVGSRRVQLLTISPNTRRSPHPQNFPL